MQTSAKDALISKDKEILAAAEKLAKKEQSHAKIEKETKNNSRASKAYKGKRKGE